MKKRIVLFFLSAWASPNFCMNFSMNMIQTVYDKLNPTTVLIELGKTGVSNDLRIKMTQQHRIDRIIPFHVEKQDTKGLCDSLTIIYAKEYPLSSIARAIAADYLSKARNSSMQANDPLFTSVTDTLDLLNPEQILEDFDKKETDKLEAIALETRVNKCIELYSKHNNVTALTKLIPIIASKNIVPGERVATLAYSSIKKQNQLNDEIIKILIEKFKVKENQIKEDPVKEGQVN